MMSEGGKKERHRRARGNAARPQGLRARVERCSRPLLFLSNISTECFCFADAIDPPDHCKNNGNGVALMSQKPKKMWLHFWVEA